MAAREEARRAAAEMRPAREVPPHGFVVVEILRSTIDAADGSNFEVAFGESVSTRLAQDGVASPSREAGLDWRNIFVEPLHRMGEWIHVVDKLSGERCSAFLDTQGKLQKLDASWTPSANPATGKLAGGFQGKPFGDGSSLTTAPLADCQRDVEPAVRWSCKHTVGATPVVANFMVEEGYYYMFSLSAGGPSACDQLVHALQAAYGTGQATGTDALADRRWQDGTVAATFSYDRATSACTFMAWSTTIGDAVERLKRERAQNAAQDL